MRLLTSSFLFLSLWAYAVAQPPPLLSLEEALKQAGQQNRKLRAGDSEILRQQELWDASSAQRFPKVSSTFQNVHLLNPIDFRVQQGALGSFAATGPIPAQDIAISNVRGTQSTTQITVTQPLTQLHKIGLGLEAQDQEIAVARHSKRGTELGVGVQVQQVYLQLVDTQNALEVAHQSLEFARELERLTAEYLKEKTVLKADLLEVQSTRAQQESQLQALERAWQSQKEQLNHLLGRDLGQDFSVALPTVQSSVQETLEQLQDLAQQQRPDLAQARARLQQALIQTEVERARYIPDVSLQFGYQNNGNSGLLPGSFLTVALVASWELWDWGSRDASIAARGHQAEAARLQVEESQSQALLDVRQRFRSVQDVEAQEMSKKLALQAAEERHRVAQARYRVRSALTRELLETRVQLAQAQRDYHKWHIDRLVAIAELYQAIGKAP